MRDEANLSSEKSVTVEIWNAGGLVELGRRPHMIFSLLAFVLVFIHWPLFKGISVYIHTYIYTHLQKHCYFRNTHHIYIVFCLPVYCRCHHQSWHIDINYAKKVMAPPRGWCNVWSPCFKPFFLDFTLKTVCCSCSSFSLMITLCVKPE